MSKGTHPRTALGQTAAQMIRRYYLHDVARDSAALTYYLLFAIFPLLIFVSTLLGILELDVDSIVTGLRQIVPGDVAEGVRSYLEYVSGNASRQLMWFSLVFSIWFPMRATGCLLHSLRKAFGKGQPKNILLDQLKIFLFAIWLMVSIGLTLVMMILPTIIRTTQESLKTVPQSYREGALALGAGKWHMVRTVVLPGAVDGIVTGCILAIGRIVGESAALLYTAGFGMALVSLFDSLHTSSATLTVALYVYATEGGETALAFSIATILMVLTLLINLTAGIIGRKLKRK